MARFSTFNGGCFNAVPFDAFFARTAVGGNAPPGNNPGAFNARTFNGYTFNAGEITRATKGNAVANVSAFNTRTFNAIGFNASSIKVKVQGNSHPKTRASSTARGFNAVGFNGSIGLPVSRGGSTINTGVFNARGFNRVRL